jgi:hypothetical protein
MLTSTGHPSEPAPRARDRRETRSAGYIGCHAARASGARRWPREAVPPTTRTHQAHAGGALTKPDQMILGTVKVVMVAIPVGHAGSKMERDACERRRTLLPIHDLAIVPAMRVCHSHRQPLCSCVAPRDGAASPSGFDEVIAPRGKVNPQAAAHARVAHHAPCRLNVANAMSEEPAGSSADGPWTASGSARASMTSDLRFPFHSASRAPPLPIYTVDPVRESIKHRPASAPTRRRTRREGTIPSQ